MYEMSTGKRLSQKRDRIRDRILEKDMKEGVHRSHNEVIKNARKRQYLSNKRLRIRDDTFQDSHRKEKH